MRKIIFFSCCIAILFASSCSQEQPVIQEQDFSGKKIAEVITEYDKAKEGLAIAVHNALKNNVEFRSLVHTEAVAQFDGDYDILLKHFVQKEITPSDPEIITRAGIGTMNVGSFLDMYIPASMSATRTDGGSIVEQLQQQYPYLQIAVHKAEEWDPATYMPSIAIAVDNYVDCETDFVPGVDNEGNAILVDAKNEPEVPFIIISDNERVDEFGNLKYNNSPSLIYPFSDEEYELYLSSLNTGGGGIEGGGPGDPKPIDPTPPTKPAAPTGLAVTPDPTAGMVLSWNNVEGATRYYIYRKGYNDTQYVKIGSTSGRYNTSYINDTDIVSKRYYIYYVTAVATNLIVFVESDPSSLIGGYAPSTPDAVSNFKADVFGNKVLLSWSNNGDVSSTTKLSYVAPATGSYGSLYNSSGATSSYTHTVPDKEKGKQVWYTITKSNAAGTSDERRDFIYPPYRNAAAGSPVYIKKIKVDHVGDVEGWIANKPEFHLKVVGHTSAGTTTEIQDMMDFKFDSRSNISQTFSEAKALNWLYEPSNGGWYNTITFALEEYDRQDGEYTLEISASVTAKLTEVLSVTQAVKLGTKFQSKPKYCGQASLRYFEKDKGWVFEFPKFGAKVYVSSDDSYDPAL